MSWNYSLCAGFWCINYKCIYKILVFWLINVNSNTVIAFREKRGNGLLTMLTVTISSNTLDRISKVSMNTSLFLTPRVLSMEATCLPSPEKTCSWSVVFVYCFGSVRSPSISLDNCFQCIICFALSIKKKVKIFCQLG